MLPAMNVDDRVEMLAGMRAGASPEVFIGVMALAASVLTRRPRHPRRPPRRLSDGP